MGVWTDALNMRFTGIEMKKMLEPESFAPTQTADSAWMQSWSDGLTTYLAVANGSNIWLYYDNGIDTPSWINASRPEGYFTDGYWDSFAWGDTCIFNNGIDAPQIYNANTAKFEDLPNWGLKSTADDILNNNPPSEKVQASCVRLVPYKSYLVAVGVTESGLYHPNKVWWSDTTNLAGYAGAPNWDYESPASLSGQIVVNPEGGAIRTAAVLNEQLIIYTDVGATAQQEVGGALVMQFRRLFNKGAAGLHCVTEFNNQHFVVSQDQVYVHDGSSVQLLAKDRVEEEFFKRVGKGGRFGTGEVDWDGLQVVKNPDRKEIIVNYCIPVQGTGSGGGEACIPVSIDTQPIDGNAGDPGATVTFGVAASGTETITYQWFEDQMPMEGETSATLVVPDTSTSNYYVVVSNPCGSAQSNVVTVVPSDTCVPVAIYVQPVFAENGDGTASATVTAGGTEPITYQWEQDNAGDGNFTTMAGETSATITVSDTSVNQYRVVTTNDCGTETSAVALVGCLVTVPSTDVTGISIWNETDAVFPALALEGTIGVDGDEIIAHTADRKIIHSTDLGETWTVYANSLPENPQDPTDHLYPLGWEKVDGLWWANLRPFSNNSNGFAYMGSTVDGSSWTFGPNSVFTDGYVIGKCFVIEGSGVAFSGRTPTNNDIEVFKYVDRYGQTTDLGPHATISNNSNSAALLPLGPDKYLQIYNASNGFRYAAHIDRTTMVHQGYSTYATGVSSPLRYGQDAVGTTMLPVGANWGGAPDPATTIPYFTPDDDPSQPVNYVTIDPALNKSSMCIDAKTHIWVGGSIKPSGVTNKWGLSYTTQMENPTALQYPCDVVLPNDMTSSGSNDIYYNLQAASGGWWVGWYRKASDQKVEIFKFQFETYTGNCTP